MIQCIIPRLLFTSHLNGNMKKNGVYFLNKNNSIGLSSLNIQIKPIAVYYGNDMSAINKKIISDIAKEKGIKEYQMYIDTQSDRYAMKYRRI